MSVCDIRSWAGALWRGAQTTRLMNHEPRIGLSYPGCAGIAPDEDEEWTPEPSPSPDDIADSFSNMGIPRYLNAPSNQASSASSSGDRMDGW